MAFPVRAKSEHTPDYMRSLLTYNAETGEIRYKIRMSARMKPGDLCGNVCARGYRRIIIDGKMYMAHRLAWTIHYGFWPSSDLDHINGDKLDNRISNLREVTCFENQQNRPCHREGVLWGTSKLMKGKYYQARVQGKYLGNFKTMEEAHIVAVEYARSMGLNLLRG